MSEKEIAKDPVAHLEWSNDEIDKLATELKGHRVSAQSLEHRLVRESKADALLEGARQQQLTEIVDLYKATRPQASGRRAIRASRPARPT